MRVWIQSPFDNLPQEGYRKQRFWLMAEAFARKGHDVVYWTGDFNHMAKAARKIVAPGTDGIELKIFPVLPYFENVGLRRVASHRAYARDWLRLASDEGAAAKPDVIITACPTISAAEAALKLGRMFSAKTAVDIMDAWPETFERLAPRCLAPLARLALAGIRLRARRIYRDADIVSGVSERYRALSGRDDFHLAYHGVEMPERIPVRRRAPGTPVRLVYAGNLGVGYDLAPVIEGVSLLRRQGVEASLDIAGKGPLEERWRRMAGEGVSFHGYLGSDELSGLLAKGDFGVIPLKDDSWVGLPYKLGDYVASGLPVLTSLGGECRSLIERFRAGRWYRPGDAAAFAEAALSLMEHPDSCSGVAGLADLLDSKKIYDGYVGLFG